MKKCYSVLILCLILVFPGITYAQISGPATGTVGTPVNFSTSMGGVSYNWSFGTTNRDLNVAYTPTVVHSVALTGANSSTPNYTSMVFDGTNWYSFTIDAVTGGIVRGSYGVNPTIAAPTLTKLTTTVATLGGNITKGIDVVYDSTDQRWFGVVTTSWGTDGIQLLDFGSAGLSNLAPTLIKVPVDLGADANHMITNQLTMKRWNGQWLCFIGGSSGKNFVRFDMGPNLGALSASSTPLVQHKLSTGTVDFFNFSLYEENGNWYAIGGNLSTVTRYNFGADLQNNAPVATVITSNITPAITGTGSFRNFMLTKGCNNQLFGYTSNSLATRWKLNFSGNINSTSIASTALMANGPTAAQNGDGMAGFCTFVYGDTLYAIGSSWSPASTFLVRVLPLTNSETRYRDKTISHTFTAPGTYKVDLLIDAGAKNGSQAYCHEIVITAASGPAQAGPYTAAPSSVCAGQSNVTYTVPSVTNAVAYRWYYTGGNVNYTASTTQPTNSLSFAANATGGVLRVWAVDNNGDSSSSSRDTTITVNALPTIASISGNSPVCVNATRVLSTTPTGGTWSSGSTGIVAVNSSNGTVTGVSAGTATITYSYTDGNSCTNTATANVTVNALPTIASISGNTPVCVNATRVLNTTPTGGTWSSGSTGIATVNSSNGTVTGVSAGTATITYSYTDANSCTNTATANVTVNALPTIAAISGNSPVCVNATRVLSTTPTGGTWSSGSTGIATVNSSNGTVTGVSAGTATITYSYTNANSCTNTATANVTVNALPTIAAISGNSPVCVNATRVLSTTPAGGTWSSGSTGIATVNSSNGTVTGISAGTATITYSYTNANSCTNTATANVTVNALPAVSINPPTVSICTGQTATLTASGANTYVWSPAGGNTATANVSPTATATYTVEGTNTSTGCKNTATRQVTVNLLPVTQVTVTGGITDVCAGDSVVMTASGSGYTYSWKDVSAAVGTGNRYTARSTGSYKVVATDAVSGCSDSTQAIDVRVYDRPLVSLDQDDTSFCIGGVITLEVNTTDTGLTYVWKQDDVVKPLATAYFLEVNESGAYKVIVGRSSVASCEDSTNEVVVTVHDLPVVNVTWDGEVLHATPGYVSYQWNAGTQGIAGAMDSTHRPSSNGGYSVTVTDSNGCENTSPIQNLTDVSVEGVVSAGSIKVYPNPSSGMVYVESPVRIEVLLYSVDGRLLQRVADARQVDLNGYADGVYLLRIMDGSGMVIGTERVMKQ